MATRAAIAVGIRTAGSLPGLPGAVNGAKEFIEWTRARSYDSTLITDEFGPVTLQSLKAIIKQIVDRGDTERLIVYFAGHGIQPTTNTALWLLSNWEGDSDEAVNVNLSFSNAKRSGIGQISVIADACRSAVQGASSVGGGSMFPRPPASAGRLPQWDHFLASRLDEYAQEVAVVGADAYGIFTRCLMHGLAGGAAVSRVGPPSRHIVSSAGLATYLEKAVPLQSGRTPGASVQFPEVISGWRDPDDIYAELPEFRSGLRSTPKLQGGLPPSLAFGRGVVTKAKSTVDAEIDAAEKLFSSGRGRLHFEMGQGLTIVGAEPIAIATHANDNAELFTEGGLAHIRGNGGRPQPVLMRLSNGNWLGTVILPQYVGTVTVVDGVAAGVIYVESGGGDNVRISRASRWTALMRKGRSVGTDELAALTSLDGGDAFRDPTLAILGAYAQERIGNIPGVRRIANLFGRQHRPIPYDVAMLASSTSRFAREKSLTTDEGDKIPVAGAFPLLTQGWSFLDVEDDSLHPELLRLRSGLVPSMWTTFRGREGQRLSELLSAGEI